MRTRYHVLVQGRTQKKPRRVPLLRRMRCSGGSGARAEAVWLVTGPVLSTRVRPRRVPLLGVEARE